MLLFLLNMNSDREKLERWYKDKGSEELAKECARLEIHAPTTDAGKRRALVRHYIGEEVQYGT